VEFIGTRVSEIRTKSKVDMEWFWFPGELNPADMGTRPTMTPRDMGEGTPYQIGLPWMYQLVDSWPVRKDFTSLPAEECCKDVTPAMCAVRIFGYLMMAVAAFRKQYCRIPLAMMEAGG
jgi:hypothetical protein